MSAPARTQRGAIERALAGALERHGERPAVADGGRTWSYAELRRRIDEAADRLAGYHHVGFRLGNRPEYVSLYFGALEAGCLPLLLDASFNRSEVEAIRADCGLDALVDLLAHGFTREDVWDIGAITGLFALSNRLAHLADMRPNEQVYTLGRGP
jgi:acyl-CoA synthetase (AMP-forming)/AMP-acid ligase II